MAQVYSVGFLFEYNGGKGVGINIYLTDEVIKNAPRDANGRIMLVGFRNYSRNSGKEYFSITTARERKDSKSSSEKPV